jgi:dCMP deaminase
MMQEDPAKQRKYDIAYLRMAREWAQLSYCERRKVGALIIKDRMIVSDGYNGTPSGFENICEDDENYTKWYVLHAEANAILKMASSTNSSVGATLYLTLSPCKECSKLVHQSGIKRLVYLERYKDDSGLKFLEKAGVALEQISEQELEQ